MIEHLKLERFTAFESLDMEFSPGINVFIGDNGTGKTHILKVVYAACDIIQSKKNFAEKINDVFYPSGKQLGRLVQRAKKSVGGSVEVVRKLNDGKKISIRLTLSNHTKSPFTAVVNGVKQWMEYPMKSVFIPVKDMLANAPGFRSLYAAHDIHFEEVYSDIVDRALYSLLKGPMDRDRQKLLDILRKAMDGNVITENEEFYLKSPQGKLEFTLLAEGYRKLGLLWLLIQNGTLLNGSALFWDEPETNLNPRLIRTVIGILMELQRMGVQIFVSTHDYVVLKEFDLAIQENDRILYHSLFREEKSKRLAAASCQTIQGLKQNAIEDTFGSLIDRQISKDMGGLGK